jgi:outer membrane receptor for monomeric catechols
VAETPGAQAQEKQEAQEINTDNTPVLGEVTVTAPPEEGSAEVGERSLQDTLYTLNVISSDLIENQISVDNTQIFQIAPNVQPSTVASVTSF